MTYFCLKNQHHFLPIIPRPYFFKKNFSWECSFSDNCKYDIGNDQLDWNKLVGISNKLHPRMDSVRFVWRYNIQQDKFDIGLFVEKNFKFTPYNLISVNSNETFQLKFNFFQKFLIARANQTVQNVDFIINNFTYRLNPYFGGNMSSPHFMKLSLK